MTWRNGRIWEKRTDNHRTVGTTWSDSILLIVPIEEGNDDEEKETEDMAMTDAATGQNVHALEDAEARVGAMLGRDSGKFFADRLLPLLVRLAEPCLNPDGSGIPVAFTYTRRDISTCLSPPSWLLTLKIPLRRNSQRLMSRTNTTTSMST